MKSNLLVNQHINYYTQPLFFGDGRNIMRLDLPGDTFITKQIDRQKGQMWFGTDYGYDQDAVDFSNMEPKLQELFMANLKLQQLYDSLVARSVPEVFAPVTTSPVCEQWWQIHSFFEQIHYDSYSLLIKALPVNASTIFDDIMVNPAILARAQQVADVWDDMVLLNAKRTTSQTGLYTEEHKRQLILSLYALNILEAVLFQSSFLVTWAFAENGMMEASAKSMAAIGRDEAIHAAISVYLLNSLRKDNDYAYLFVELEPQVVAMYQEALNADYDWINYIYRDGAQLLGLNSNALKQYADHNINLVMRQIGLPPVTPTTPNPCTWADKYKSLGNVETALQETDSGAYLLGKLNKSDVWADL